MQPQIEPGEEYTIHYAPGDRDPEDGDSYRVRAESEVWTNSKGISGFDVTMLDSMGKTQAGEFKIIQTHLFEVTQE